MGKITCVTFGLIPIVILDMVSIKIRKNIARNNPINTMKKGMTAGVLVAIGLLVAVALIFAIFQGQQTTSIGKKIDSLKDMVLPDKTKIVVIPGTTVSQASCPTITLGKDNAANVKTIAQKIVDCNVKGKNLGTTCCAQINTLQMNTYIAPIEIRKQLDKMGYDLQFKMLKHYTEPESKYEKELSMLGGGQFDITYDSGVKLITYGTYRPKIEITNVTKLINLMNYCKYNYDEMTKDRTPYLTFNCYKLNTSELKEFISQVDIKKGFTDSFIMKYDKDNDLILETDDEPFAIIHPNLTINLDYNFPKGIILTAINKPNAEILPKNITELAKAIDYCNRLGKEVDEDIPCFIVDMTGFNESYLTFDELNTLLDFKDNGINTKDNLKINSKLKKQGYSTYYEPPLKICFKYYPFGDDQVWLTYPGEDCDKI